MLEAGGVMTDHAPVQPRPRSGAVLAFDYGVKRVGVALGDFELKLAHPLVTITAATPSLGMEKIAVLIKEWRPIQLVVGEPYHMDGTSHQLTLRCRRFAKNLAARFNLPVAMMDERLSSYSASLDLNDLGIFGQKQKPYIDQVAALAILQSYFDQKPNVAS